MPQEPLFPTDPCLVTDQHLLTWRRPPPPPASRPPPPRLPAAPSSPAAPRMKLKPSASGASQDLRTRAAIGTRPIVRPVRHAPTRGAGMVNIQLAGNQAEIAARACFGTGGPRAVLPVQSPTHGLRQECAAAEKKTSPKRPKAAQRAGGVRKISGERLVGRTEDQQRSAVGFQQDSLSASPRTLSI